MCEQSSETVSFAVFACPAHLHHRSWQLYCWCEPRETKGSCCPACGRSGEYRGMYTVSSTEGIFGGGYRHLYSSIP